MTIADSSGYMMETGSISLPWTPEEEHRIIEDLTREAEANPKEGNSYYVISARWFMGWQKYTGLPVDSYSFGDNSSEPQHSMISNTSERPGPIDNTSIIVGGGDDPQLIRTLEEERDYKLLPCQVWEKLYEWYKGGPALPRKMIALGDNKQLTVEVFPLCFNLIDSRDQSETVVRLSKKDSLRQLYENVCHLKGLKPEQVHLWDYFNKNRQKLLTSSEQTLEESLLEMDQDILLEVQVNGNWSSANGIDSTGNELALVSAEPMRSSVTIAGGPTVSNGYSKGLGTNFYQTRAVTSTMRNSDDTLEILKPVSKVKGGLAGLQNLGNTCFMNSALQCLVHTPQLAEYFLQDFSDEINWHNPLGMRGELALAFGELLRKLWSSGQTPVAPRAFKGKLGRFAPQFSGYNQHDSQELLAFLLDGLHEDLNRVKQKPYFETKDSDGRSDKEVADELWRYHKARNDSVIVDTCQGQYKSTLVCPSCEKISITFDPFMYLSLPLPSTATRSMTVTVFYADGSRLPMPYTVTVLKQGCCKDLNQALATECCLRSDECLLLAEVYDHRIYRYLETPSEQLVSIKDDEHIVAYRLPKKASQLTRLEICHRYLEKGISESLKAGERKLFLTPLVTFLEDPRSGVDVELAVSRVLSPLRKASCNSLKISLSQENASVSNATDNDYTSQSHPMESTESDEMASSELSFHIYFTDDRGSNCIPILKDSPIKAARVVKIMLDWFEREQELYDASYLKDLPEVYKTGFTVKKTKQEAISLFSCLDAFLKEEPLGPDDMWYCPRCKEHRQATKKLDLWRLPDILVFHLKRFSYSRWFKNKLDTFVNFPKNNLDLSKYISGKDTAEGPYVYELYAVSNHYGGLGGGHYTAYCKLIDDDRWYHFDDSHVSPVDEAAIRTSAAYVLFYRRVREKNTEVGEPSKAS
ncbi:cysteine protease [Lithospermum erythrorhizon]|uniref:Ubiquitin carboxyl-terminal hydrolase n=1 Tax=Lithospermum erythrorhizon TaxID=34254 RepID=A0AAV3PUG3_LITER